MARIINSIKLKECSELYIKQGRTLQDISALTGVSKTTLSKYYKEYDWETSRKEYQKTIACAQDAISEEISKLTGDLSKEKDPTARRAIIYSLSQIINIRAKNDDLIEKRSAIYIVSDLFSEYINQHPEISVELKPKFKN